MDFWKSVWDLVHSEVLRDVLVGVIVFLLVTSTAATVRWLYRKG